MKFSEIPKGKIWIGNNPELANELFTRLYDIGYDSKCIACPLENNPSCIFIHEDNSFGAYGQDYTKQDFDNDIDAVDYVLELYVGDILSNYQTYEIF